jgi:hypothetical protein
MRHIATLFKGFPTIVHKRIGKVVGYGANNVYQKPELLRPYTHPIKLFDSGVILRAYMLVESLSTPEKLKQGLFNPVALLIGPFQEKHQPRLESLKLESGR